MSAPSRAWWLLSPAASSAAFSPPCLSPSPHSVVALLFVAVANITSSAISVYASGLALRHLEVLKVKPWWHVVLWSLVPCMPFVIWPAELSGMGSNFLAYNGTLYAPVVGILFADFVFIRRQRINVRAVFDDDPNFDRFLRRRECGEQKQECSQQGMDPN